MYASYEALTRFLPPQSIGWDNWWLVLILRVWYHDCKAHIFAKTRVICGAWEGNNISIYVEHNSKVDNNTE
jgi:hypothetical protein